MQCEELKFREFSNKHYKKAMLWDFYLWKALEAYLSTSTTRYTRSCWWTFSAVAPFLWKPKKKCNFVENQWKKNKRKINEESLTIITRLYIGWPCSLKQVLLSQHFHQIVSSRQTLHLCTQNRFLNRHKLHILS